MILETLNYTTIAPKYIDLFITGNKKERNQKTIYPQIQITKKISTIYNQSNPLSRSAQFGFIICI